MSRWGPSSMASTAAKHCPGTKGVFISGIRFFPAVWTGGRGTVSTAAALSPSLYLVRRRSSGLAASVGIAQAPLNFCAP